MIALLVVAALLATTVITHREGLRLLPRAVQALRMDPRPRMVVVIFSAMVIRARAVARACLLSWSLAGCTAFGPATLRDQQADYASALADAGKQQTLLNIVKLRYGDVPAMVSVNQIVAGYSVQGTFSVGTDLLTGGSLHLSDDANVGVGGTFTNNPTVTYAPVTGADFARTLLAPMPPADLFALILAGVPAELVLGLGLHSIGPYANKRATPGALTAADPGFGQAFELLLQLQRSGRLAVQLTVNEQDRVATLRIGRGEPPDSAESRLRSMLKLLPDRDTFEVVYTLAEPKPGQIAIRTRSLVEVLSQLAADIDVPAGDLTAGRTYASLPDLTTPGWFPRVEVRYGSLRPRDAFVAAFYDGDWFWIANDDLASKRVFSFVLLLTSLRESSKPGQPPVITIPVD